MADTDLAQINGTAAFPSTADVGTGADPYLVPTDGPIVCGDSNGANRAPVNRALRRTKDLLLGIRGAIFGDFVGAVKKTIQGLRVAQAGGVTHTTAGGVVIIEGPAIPGVALEIETGDIRVDNDDIQVVTGDILCDTGDVIALNGSLIGGDLTAALYAQIKRQYLRFIGTTTSGANPANGTAIPNQLRAVNTPKAWGLIGTTTTGPAVNKTAGIGYTAAYNGVAGGTIDVTFTTAMDDADYCVVVVMNNEIASGNCTPYVLNKATSGFTIKGRNQNTGSQKSFGDEAALIGFQVFGRITT